LRRSEDVEMVQRIFIFIVNRSLVLYGRLDFWRENSEDDGRSTFQMRNVFKQQHKKKKHKKTQKIECKLNHSRREVRRSGDLTHTHLRM